MTKRPHRRHERTLAVAPSSRGFGYAVIEGGQRLLNWGVRSVSGSKSAGTIKGVERMLALYQAKRLVLEDSAAKGSLRSPRIRNLTAEMMEMASTRKIQVSLLTRDQILGTFYEDGKGTKHGIARLLALRFPDELGDHLPPKRKLWASEDYRMGIFDAVALGFAAGLRDRGDRGEPGDDAKSEA